MYSRFQNLGFAANHSSNAFKNLGNSMQVGGARANYCMDTILRLDSPSSSIPDLTASKGVKRKWTKENEEESSMDLELDFTLHLGNEKTPSTKKYAGSSLKALELQTDIDLELSLSTGPAESDITSIHASSTLLHAMDMPLGVARAAHLDEGSTSSPWKPGTSLSSSLHAPLIKKTSLFSHQIPQRMDPTSPVPDLSSSIITTPKSSVTCTSGITQQQPQRSTSSKTCQFKGCGKGARGASGLCIAHGGGRRCQKTGCHKGAEGRTVYCKAHGGGRRCEFLGCTKSAEGRTDYCIAHGGGRRCSHEACTKGAQGSTMYCKAHGGGKRCTVPECTKSARGRTDYCVRHGGGKRCKSEGCGKSAQGSTDFCKAHGGGKRCSWGQVGSQFGSQDGPCSSFARGKTGLCASHNALVQDKRVHGGATLAHTVQIPSPSKPEKMKDVVATEDMNVDIMKMMGILAPEGRVHGGSLMAMLAGSPGLSPSDSKTLISGGPSEPRKPYMMPQSWM
ncbi:unnamed protein product, partial [Vitis vinifera]